jgi:tripartite-type tricarboxylate transporter receptor subunit TctC
MFNRTAGTQFKMIAGYKGTSDIDIALERGEVDGVALSWASVTSVHGQKYANGDIIPVFAVADGRMKALPNVPSMTEFGRDDAEKTFLGIYTSSGTIGRALVFPPGVPADRVAALRAAYEKTIRDPEFLAEVKQRQIWFEPMSGPDLQAYVDKYMKTPAERVQAAGKVYNELLAMP